MTFILRWPAVLVLFALVALCVLAAVSAGAAIAGYQAPITQVQDVQAEAAAAGAAEMTWLDVGLWGAAALFFLIAAVRLIRRTQGFWVWLLGFAAYGGRWAYQQGQDVITQFQAIDWGVFQEPQKLLAEAGSFEVQVALLAVILIVGVFIAIIDGADRAYWDKQGA
ncbi:MAG TPA: hypothetical protein PKY87_03755 [Terricaulis sp.]|nr:hypothetical protein [Terricaulis sp.]